MAGITSRQELQTKDGTVLVIDSWLATPNTITMQPGSSDFTGSCPIHGKIRQAYVAILVGWAVQDHANELHGGLVSPKDLLETGPYIQL